MRFHRPHLSRRSLWALVAILFWLALRAIYDDYRGVHQETTVATLREGDYVVQRVGEALSLVVRYPDSSPPFKDARIQGRNGRVQARIKFLGLRPVSGASEARNAEIAALAREWMKEHLVGREVRLRLDRRRQDDNRVFLAYVYHEGRLVNAQLLSEGLARLDVDPADVREVVRELQRAEEDAKVARVGCWQ